MPKSKNRTQNKRPRSLLPRPRRRRPRRRNAPIAYDTQTRVTYPKLRKYPVTHTEYIRDIITTTTSYETFTIPVNPGLRDSFPWLHAIAANYETYLLTNLTYRFVPSVGTTTAGSIHMSPDYDAGDTNTGLTKGQVMQFEDTVRGPLWKPLSMRATPRNLHKRKQYYCRKGPLADNLDIKSYDTANLIVGVSTPGGAMQVGELFCDYSLVFETPQLDDDSPDVARINTTTPLNSQNPFSDSTRPEDKAALTLLDNFVKIVDGNSISFSKPNTPYQVVTQIIGSGLGLPTGWSLAGGGTINNQSIIRNGGETMSTTVMNMTTGGTASVLAPNQFNFSVPLSGSITSALTTIEALNIEGFVI